MVVESCSGKEGKQTRIHSKSSHIEGKLAPRPEDAPKVGDFGGITRVRDAALPPAATNQTHWPC